MIIFVKFQFYSKKKFIVDGARLTRLREILGELAAMGYSFWCLALCGMS